MSFLTAVGWFDVRWWIWLYFFFTILAGLSIGIYWRRETLKRLYYQTRFPERTIQIIMHYKSGLYNTYWRLIPDNNLFKINNKTYEFTDKEILRENDFFADKNKRKKTIIKVDGKEYEFEDLMQIKRKGTKYPEIHYFHNYPKPLSFDFDTDIKDKDGKLILGFTGKQMTDFEENDLFTKLLRLNQERNTLLFLIMVSCANAIMTLFIIAKMMGWLK